MADTTLYCSFCGSSDREVRKLIAGPTVFICNFCVLECVAICLGTRPQQEQPAHNPLDQRADSERGGVNNIHNGGDS